MKPMTPLGLQAGKGLGLNKKGKGKGQKKGFTPGQLAQLAFWYDAASSPVVEPGGAVERWDDLSGNGNHAGQATGAAQPLKTSDADGRAVLRFDGADDVLLIDAPPDLAAGTTVFAVFRMRTRVDFRRILAAAAATGVDHEQFFAFQNDLAADQRFQLFGKSTQADQVLMKRPDSTEVQYALFTIGTDSAELRDLNGATTDTTSAAALGTPAAIVLGAGYNNDAPSSFGAVDLYEVGLFDRVLNAAELDQLEAYLRGRYGLVWNPMHIGANLAWYHDALESGFTLDATRVDQWDDLSGAARHWTQSGDARPTKTTDGAYEIVRFDGVDDVLSMAGVLPALEPFSVAVVYAVRSRGDFEGVMSAAPASGADHTDFWSFRTATAASNEMELFGRSLETDQLTLARPDSGTVQIAIWTAASGDAELRDDAGALTDTYDGGFGTPAEIVLGGRFDGAPTGFAEIDVYATVGVARALSSADQQKLIDWAAIRWNV